MKHIIRKITRPVVLALVGFALMSASAQAATMDIWVKAYNTTWSWLIPGSNTGGRLVWNSTYGCYITDRAQRGEPIDVDFGASTPAEYRNPTISRCWLSSTAGTANLRLSSPTLWAYTSFIAPTSPFWDNNYVNIVTASGPFSVRIPIGTRPAR